MKPVQKNDLKERMIEAKNNSKFLYGEENIKEVRETVAKETHNGQTQVWRLLETKNEESFNEVNVSKENIKSSVKSVLR